MYEDRYYIKEGPQGCFLDPPDYPSHKYHIENKDDTCSVSLNKHRLESKKYSYITRAIRIKALKLIDDWYQNRPILSSLIVRDWIYQTLGYFNNCFQSIDSSWDVDNIRIKSFKNKSKEFIYRYQVRTQSLNVGVHYIRIFYPEYKASIEDFKNAYWGKGKIFKV